MPLDIQTFAQLKASLEGFKLESPHQLSPCAVILMREGLKFNEKIVVAQGKLSTLRSYDTFPSELLHVGSEQNSASAGESFLPAQGFTDIVYSWSPDATAIVTQDFRFPERNSGHLPTSGYHEIAPPAHKTTREQTDPSSSHATRSRYYVRAF